MSWRQSIVDASVGVNRSVFEMNRRGHPITSPLYKEQPDLNYIKNEVMAAIEGFPEGYFKHPGLKLSKKEIIKMIGNAVPVGMARALLEPMAKYLIESELERVAV